MHRPSAVWLLSLALGLAIPAGCGESASTSPPPEKKATAPAPTTPSDTAEAGARVPLIEASGIAVRGGGKVAVIGSDQDASRLFGVSLDDFSKRWYLPYPPGTPPLRDVEALVPWGKMSVLVCCSQRRTRNKDKEKPERNRIALVALSDDARQILHVQVYDHFRGPLVAHLLKELPDRLENPTAVAEGRPQDGGFNMEGAALWKDRLLVGLRAPVAKGGGAIVIPIDYPERLFESGGASRPPEMGKPYVLPTQPGEGIRDMAADGDTLLLILGPSGQWKTPPARLARWNPATGDLVPIHAKGFKHIDNPEGIAPDPEGRLLICQDQKAPISKPILFRLELRKGDDVQE